jgi:hypothetical protein
MIAQSPDEILRLINGMSKAANHDGGAIGDVGHRFVKTGEDFGFH